MFFTIDMQILTTLNLEFLSMIYFEIFIPTFEQETPSDRKTNSARQKNKEQAKLIFWEDLKTGQQMFQVSVLYTGTVNWFCFGR